MTHRISHPNDLFEHITGVLAVDLLEHAVSITDEVLLSSVIDNETGVYIKGSMTPLIPSNLLIMDTNSAVIKSYDELLKAKTDVYTTTGDLVITQRDLRLKAKYLSNGPDIPVSVINMAMAVVEEYLSVNCKYSRSVHRARSNSYLKEDVVSLEMDGKIEDAFCKLLDEVHNFIRNDTWHIYFYRLKGTTLIIEKTIDWRIYDWHCIQHKENNELEEFNYLNYSSDT